jgi:hypothetical protein
MAEPIKNDARTDLTTARRVDEALNLSMQQGIDPALRFMEQVGVPRAVALRVLCSPEHFRKQDRRRSMRPRRSQSATL